MSERLLEKMREEVVGLSKLVTDMNLSVKVRKRGDPLRTIGEPLNARKRLRWVNANLESTLAVEGDVADDLRKLLGMDRGSVEFLRLTVKIPSFRLCGFVDPPNFSWWGLDQEGFSESIAGLSGSLTGTHYETNVQWGLSNRPSPHITRLDGIKMRLLVRSLILSVLKAWRRILEGTYLED